MLEPILFAVGVGVIAYVAVMLFMPKGQSQGAHTKQMLDELHADTREALSAQQQASIGITRYDYSDLAPWAQRIYKLPPFNALYRMVLYAGYMRSAELFLFYFLLLAFVFAAVLSQASSLVVGVVLGAVLSYGALMLFLRHSVKKRTQKFLDLFPDVLDMIVRSVRSGFPVVNAIEMVAENMEDPIKTEFTLISEEIAMGRSLPEAVQRMAMRVKEQDVNFFSVVLTIQQETGGNLSEVLSNLSSMIRKRKQLRGKVAAMTSEGRATAWIMGLLPVFLFLVMLSMQPDYMQPLLNTTPGNIILGVAGALIVGAISIIRKMSQVDV